MKTKLAIVLIALASGASFVLAQIVYTYKCPRDGVILQSTSTQPPRCPNDGATMQRTLY